MVYCGRPSRGCQNCKTRRIKCDESRPQCLNCEKTNRECPGFPDEVDLIFRNETPGVKRKARKTSVSGQSTDASRVKADANELDGYDDPHTPDNRKRRRRGTRSSAQENGLSVSPRRDSKQTDNLLQFQSQFQLSPTIEQQATTFFFKNFVLSPRGMDTTRGYLEVAASMFDQAKEGSALRLATEAVAISAMANEPRQKHLRHLAARLYGRALAATQRAIKNPKEATSDATLLSILLFALYESISSSDHSMPAWTKHIGGAVAIVKARGVEQFENPQSLSLFRCVRAQMLANAVQQHKPIDDFPGPKGWLSDLPDDTTGAFKILECSIALPYFVSNAKSLIDREKTDESIKEVTKLLEQALETQQAFRNWELYMPSKWAPRSTASVSCTIDQDQIEDMEAWPGPMHTYEDVNVSSIRNNNRVNQMLCSSIVIDTLRWLDPAGYTSDERYDNAKNRVQSLVDDICYSVPFHLWGQVLGDNTGSEEYNRTATEAIGGYLLIWPLYAASNMQWIPDIQRRWLRGRMRAIARHYGLEQKAFSDAFNNSKLDVANSLAETNSCPNPFIRQDERRSSQDTLSPSHTESQRQTLIDHNKEESILVDPVLLAMTSPNQQMLDSADLTTLAPTWTELVTA